MKKQIIDLVDVKRPESGFSHVVKAENFIFLSSQLSADLKTGMIIHDDIKGQTKRAMENIKYLLSQCGCTMDNIVKVVIYFRDVTDRKSINEVYSQFFSPNQQPAKISVQAASPVPGIDVEIEVTAITG